MAIAAIFVGIGLGKRLLYSIDAPGCVEDVEEADEDTVRDHLALYSPSGEMYEPREDGYTEEEVRDMIEGHIMAGCLDEAKQLCDEYGFDRDEFQGWNWG